MATLAEPTREPGNSKLRERRFFQLWTLVAFLTIVAGFTPSWFARPWLSPAGIQPLTPIVWAHGLTYTGWLLLFATQVGLIGTGRLKQHRSLGRLSLLFLVLLPVLAFLAAMSGAARQSGPPVFPSDQFLLLPLAAVPVLPWLVWQGWKNRFNAHVHKRMMMLVTAGMVGPGAGRAVPGPLGLLVIPMGFAASILVFDLISSRKIARPVLIAGVVTLATQLVPVLIWSNPVWLSISHRLIDWWG